MRTNRSGRNGKVALCVHLTAQVRGSNLLLLPLLVCVLSAKLCGCQTGLCSVSVVGDPLSVTLTCHFSFDLSTLRASIIVDRFNSTGDVVELATCERQERSFYHCTPKTSGVTHIDVDNATTAATRPNGSEDEEKRRSQQITLGLPLSDLSAAVDGEFYQYLCLVVGGEMARPLPCLFPSIGHPDAPVLTIMDCSTDSIEVSWNFVADDTIPIVGLELNYTRSGGKEAWQSVQLRPHNSSYVITNLLCGTLYHLVVRAVNVIGVSSQPRVLPVQTNGSVPDMSSRCPLVREINATSVTLHFIGSMIGADDDVYCPIGWFSVTSHRHRHHGNPRHWERRVQNVSSDVRTLTLHDLTPSSQYTVEVRAHTDAGSSSCSLHFVSLPSPPPLHTNRTSGGRKDKHDSVLVIALSTGVPLFVLAIVTILLTVGLCVRRARQRGDNSDRPMIDGIEAAEMETSAGEATQPIQEERDAMLATEGE